MTPPTTMVPRVFQKKVWKFKQNPFPTSGIAQLGGTNPIENGLLYEPKVNAKKFTETVEKFMVGAAYSGLKFGYLWSIGSGPGDADARGFGKSVMMQHLVADINDDFGRTLYRSAGLDDDDADDAPMCGLLTSFDTAQIRSLNAALFTAVEYGVDFRLDDQPSLVERLRDQLVERAGGSSVPELTKLVLDQYRALRGRTLGPPDEKLIMALCDRDSAVAADYLDQVKPASRTRNGGNYLATFLIFARAAGMKHVLLCCDQLEDLASTTTAKSKRDLETERFRDIILETLPMADMLSVVVTMHPRAALAIGQAWQLADLPPFDMTEANKHRVVILAKLRDADEATQLLVKYLDAARMSTSGRIDGDTYPFTAAGIQALYNRSNGKPRDILRKAHGLIESAAVQNEEVIDEDAVSRYLDAIGPDTDDDIGPIINDAIPSSVDWSQG